MNTLSIKILLISVIIISLWLIASMLLTLQSNNLIFQNSISRVQIPKGNYKEEFIQSNGNNIGIRIIEATLPSDKYILYTHGNTGRLENFISELSKKGTVYSPTYPGYAESEGAPSQQGTLDAAINTYDYMVEVKGIPENKIIIVGQSLGGSVAAFVASKKPNANKLVLINTFASVQSMCWKSYSILCVFSNGIFNTAQYAQDIRLDVVHFGYTGDQTIPYDETLKLSKYFKSAKTYKMITLDKYSHTRPNWDVVLPLI